MILGLLLCSLCRSALLPFIVETTLQISPENLTVSLVWSFVFIVVLGWCTSLWTRSVPEWTLLGHAFADCLGAARTACGSASAPGAGLSSSRTMSSSGVSYGCGARHGRIFISGPFFSVQKLWHCSVRIYCPDMVIIGVSVSVLIVYCDQGRMLPYIWMRDSTTLRPHAPFRLPVFLRNVMLR
jgi:hypothetical protein